MDIVYKIKELVKKLMPRFLLGWYHFLLAFFGALIYGFPSRKLKVIGVTGTNGKTTTISLAAKILETAGYKVALASSISFKIGGKERENRFKMTMPGRCFLQKFLREAVRASCQYVLLEVTSEGVLQHRHRFINFQAAVFTNLSAEHIERHGSFENYRAAKGRFFKAAKKAHIINLDDENAGYFLDFPAETIYGFSLNERLQSEIKNLIKAEKVSDLENGLSFIVDNLPFNIPLIGRFNVYNSLAAIGVGLSQGVSLEICQKALAKAEGVPGRMEEVVSNPFRVVVDYAFTPNALEQVYQTLSHKLINPSTHQLICVLGACGGGRDKWKRPILGALAAKHCDEIIVTNEDPYDEPPMDIINQVAEGAGEKAIKILDRREAIRKALTLAKPGDTAVITGKGSEPWLCVENGKKIPWDDRKIAREEFDNSKNDK